MLHNCLKITFSPQGLSGEHINLEESILSYVAESHSDILYKEPRVNTGLKADNINVTQTLKANLASFKRSFLYSRKPLWVTCNLIVLLFLPLAFSHICFFPLFLLVCFFSQVNKRTENIQSCDFEVLKLSSYPWKHQQSHLRVHFVVFVVLLIITTTFVREIVSIFSENFQEKKSWVSKIIFDLENQNNSSADVVQDHMMWPVAPQQLLNEVRPLS